MAHWPDHIIAEHIKKETQAVTHSTKRQDERQLIVQYINRPHQELALKRYRYLLPHSLAGQVIYFQRFVENEVFCEIRHQIAHTPFMVMGPERHMLDALCTGCTPNVPKLAQNSVLQVGSCIVLPNAQFQLSVAHLVLTTFGIHYRMRLNRSAGYVLPDVFASWPDTLIEEHIEGNTEAIITCSRRASGRHLIVQYDDVQQLQKALSRYPYLEPYRLDRETMQRFVELNVMDEIRHRIRNNPGFMVMCPERHVLEALYTGSSPDVPTDWAHCTELPAVQPVAVPSKAKQLIIAKAIKKNFRVKCTFNKKPKRNIPVKAQLPWQTAMQEESGFD
ncbi:hypothetical protein pipiens_001310 [Culex pipiens pipiens]|uniref:Uncharacterized protein n=1 Tax=Culex pipiens pipiens TaxID=38569 RepID=A0ABD1D310_CULPP